MKPVTLIATLLATLINLTVLSPLGKAGCKGDCREEYESDVDSCHLLYSDADDADDLQQCVQEAKDDYDACIEECDN